MPTTIQDNGASLKISDGTITRNVTKLQIIEVTVIKSTIIRIDIGQGALRNIFISFGDVTSPVTANPAALRDKINDFLAPVTGGAVGSATEAKQTEEIDILNTINSSITTMKTLVTTIDGKIFYEPLLVDDSGAGVIYNGFAMPGTAQELPQWAIQRIQRVGNIDVYTWANGNKNFTNVWINREALSYL